MADFQTHLYGAAAVGSAAALGVYSVGWASPEDAQLLFFLAIAGGLLPDIDSDSSKPVRVFFSLLGVALAFLVCFPLVAQLAVVDLTLVWIGVFLAVRYVFFGVFAHYTVHRGVWHSWLAIALAGLATANAAHHLLDQPAWHAWLCGLFVALGYLTHLILDELASVDLLGNRVKRSFGTALKPFSSRAPLASFVMLGCVLALAWAAPVLKPPRPPDLAWRQAQPAAFTYLMERFERRPPALRLGTP